jgi:cytoskeletal protein CcmA (bactofilin family)
MEFSCPCVTVGYVEFKRFMKTETKLSDGISGFLDKGINLNGELHFSGMLRIDGNFTGSILSEDRLVIGEHAVVRAEITVGEIEIAGQVVGNIDAKQRAEILASGRVNGDIHTPNLSISPGSILNGRVCMPGPAQEEPVVQ